MIIIKIFIDLVENILVLNDYKFQYLCQEINRKLFDQLIEYLLLNFQTIVVWYSMQYELHFHLDNQIFQSICMEMQSNVVDYLVMNLMLVDNN